MRIAIAGAVALALLILLPALSANAETVSVDLPAHHPNTPAALTIRVGLHYGPAILEGGDVFGDAVNVAARMASLAKGGQIITTSESVQVLPPILRSSTRHLDRVSIKGKAEEIDIFEVIWQSEDVTRMATGLLKGATKTARLTLHYHSDSAELLQDTLPFILGRGKKADMVVNDSMASREHARIECRRGKFVLTDMSTNGTYVRTPDGRSYLRREDIVLSGKGQIALGRDVREASEIVEFNCDG